MSSFWKGKTNRMETYEVKGQMDDLYVTQKKIPETTYYEPINCYATQKMRVDEGYLIQKGVSPPKKIKVVSPERHLDFYDT